MLAAVLMSGCASAHTTDYDRMSDESKPDVKRLKPVSRSNAISELGATGKGAVEIGCGMQGLVDRAKSDLMSRIGVAENEIEVVEAVFVIWPDSSVGCARPGFQYLQVLTNGSRIVLRAGNRRYHYHSGKDYVPFLCEAPTVRKPPAYAPDES